MNHAGIVLPCASLRWPVSISWFISTFTSVESPTTFARIFIGSAIVFALQCTRPFAGSDWRLPAATAQRDLDLLCPDVVIAIGLDQRIDGRPLRHPDANGD